MKDALKLDSAQTAVLTIHCQRGNLEPTITSLPVPESECDRVISGNNRLLALARRAGVSIIHTTTVYEAPLLANHPFERAMLDLDEAYVPALRSSMRKDKKPIRHRYCGPMTVHSRAAAESTLPTRRFASLKANASIGPEGGIP
jgi:nicotinamidase-related amidase